MGTPEQAFWSVGDWVNLSIGQGDVLVSPLQLVRAYSAIENGGTLVTPHVGREVREQNGELVKGINPEPAVQVNVDDAYLQNTTEGLRGVTEPKGTAASVFKGSRLPTIGKSGTGEMTGGQYVNWFVGWTENQEQPLVVAVTIEGGGVFQTGSEMTAGPAVRHILEAYYGVEQSPEDPQPTATVPIVDAPPAQ